MKQLKLRRITLLIGDIEDFESPAWIVHAWVKTTRQAESALALAAHVEGVDPISWSWA